MGDEVMGLESRPTNHMEVEGELCKLFYAKFGNAALPVIEAVFTAWGQFLGERLKNQLPSRDFKDVVEAHIKPALQREPKPEIVELSPDRVELKIFVCPYHLNGYGKELCEAVMAMDRAIISTASDVEVKMSLPKSLAAGDEWCHGIFERGGTL